MPIAITDEHQELAATVRGVLTSHKALAANRALLESDDEPRPSYWREMAELGWLGIHLPEEHGGAGAGLLELVVVLDELGRQVAPGPFLPDRAGLGRHRPVRQRRAARAPPARPGRRDRGGRARPRRAARPCADGVLDGDAGIVLGGGGGRPAAPAGRRRRRRRAARTPTVSRRRHQEPRPDATLGRRDGVVAWPSRDEDVLVGAARRARALARTLGAAEAVGVMAACTDAAVAYAKERVQFGRTIGTFQAVKHHCADMLVAAELATAAVWDAARAAGDTADEFELAAAMAATWRSRRPCTTRR